MFRSIQFLLTWCLSVNLGFSLVAEIQIQNQPVLWPTKTSLPIRHLSTGEDHWTSIVLLTSNGPVIHQRDKASELDSIPWPDTEGQGWIPFRLISTTDRSDWHFFVLTELDPTRNPKPGLEIGTAPIIQDGLTLTGVVPELGFHYYILQETPGTWMTLECMANRVGSSLDCVIRILDSAHKEILWLDDTPGFGRDICANWKMPEDGKVYLEIRDVAYQGGKDAFYVVEWGPTSNANPVKHKPLVGARGDSVATTTSTPFYPGFFQHSIRWPRTSNDPFTPAYFNPGLNVLTPPELSAMNRRLPLSKSRPHISLIDRLEGKSESQKYTVSLDEGQYLHLVGWTRVIGSELDLVMELVDPQGKTMVRKSGEGPLQPWLVIPIVETGDYDIKINGLTQAASKQPFFQCDVATCFPGVQVTSKNEAMKTTPGGELTIEINVERFTDHREWIFELEPLPEVLTACDTYVSGDEKEKTLKWKVSPDAIPGIPYVFRIKGRASESDDSVPFYVLNQEAYEGQFPLMTLPPPELNGWFTFFVENSDKENLP